MQLIILLVQVLVFSRRIDTSFPPKSEDHYLKLTSSSFPWYQQGLRQDAGLMDHWILTVIAQNEEEDHVDSLSLKRKSAANSRKTPFSKRVKASAQFWDIQLGFHQQRVNQTHY